jgi:hypothetical protein
MSVICGIFQSFFLFCNKVFQKIVQRSLFASAEGAYSVCVIDHPGQKLEIEKNAEKKFDRK